MTRKRSPNYPGIGLKRGIALIQELYDKHHRESIPAPVALHDIGYSINSSTGRKIMPALSYYGLIDIHGKDTEKKIKLSNLGFTIIKNPDEMVKRHALKKAALSPAIFGKIYSKHQERLPTDSLLKYELESEFDFNPRIIPEFLIIFKETMGFAKVYESGIIEEEATEETEESEGGVNISKPPPPSRALPMGGTDTIPLGKGEMEIAKYPVGKGVSIRLIASGPVTQKAIKKLAQLLDINMDDFPEDDAYIPVTDEPSED